MAAIIRRLDSFNYFDVLDCCDSLSSRNVDDVLTHDLGWAGSADFVTTDHIGIFT
jgi:hypothetical protein